MMMSYKLIALSILLVAVIIVVFVATNARQSALLYSLRQDISDQAEYYLNSKSEPTAKTIQQPAYQPQPIPQLPLTQFPRQQEKLLPGFRQGYDLTPTIIDGLPYRYTPPEASGLKVTGSDFHVNPEFIRKLELPPKKYFDLNNETYMDFRIVTAGDTSHYEEIKDLIGSAQKNFPNHKVFFYDMGLSHPEKLDVQSWCNVELIEFPMETYPLHVQNKGSKCFKFLVIQDAMRRHGAVLWVDASVRLKHHIKEWDIVFKVALSSGGISMGSEGYKYDGIFTVIGWADPNQFHYLVTDEVKLTPVPMIGSCIVLMYNTEKTFSEVLWWMYLCSLDKNCCSTPSGCGGALNVRFEERTRDEKRAIYNCHNYDQSMVNTLLANAYGYNNSLYAPVEQRHWVDYNSRNTYPVDRC